MSIYRNLHNKSADFESADRSPGTPVQVKEYPLLAESGHSQPDRRISLQRKKAREGCVCAAGARSLAVTAR
jgi:hypothetical protein